MSVMSTRANRIAATFARLRQRGETALIPYLMAGDPSLADTETLVLVLEKSGADLIEIGVPFSDPIADGPVIQRAAERALRVGTSLQGIIKMVASLRARTSIPLLLMAYYNTILSMGEQRFCREAVDAGVDGVIVPDMPLEEAGPLQAAAAANGPCLIFLLAPTSTPARQTAVIAHTTGFIYYVSMTGTTGAKLRDTDTVQRRVKALRKKSGAPVAVGFGIATPDDARRIGAVADGVIVGSALVRTIEEHRHMPDCVQAVGQFTTELKAALRATHAS